MASGERIAIVGAGIVGCAVAFELARRGAVVTVLDRRGIGEGATQASAGILAPFTEAHDAPALFDLTVRGLAAYDAFVERVRAVSRYPFEYLRTGTLEIADTSARERELRARVTAPWAGSADLRWLNGEALRALVPSICADATGALFCGTHGHVAVPSFLAAIADAAQHSGATFESGQVVVGVEPSRGGVRILTGGAVREFDRVVLSAGSWTPQIPGAGERAHEIVPIRGQLVRLHAPSVRLPAVLWSGACYIVPWTDGTMLVGATSEDVGFDERATAEGVRGLLAAAEDLIPALASATYVDVRVGLRPGIRTGLPVLGPTSDPRILLAAGHFRNGILLAPLTAALVADYVFHGTVDPAFSAT